MPAWLVAVLAKVAEFEFPKILNWITIQLKKLTAASDMQKKEQDNLKKYDDAVKTGNLDDQAKEAENLLNGTSNKP